MSADLADGHRPNNVLGGIPTIALDYSPAWDAQLFTWTVDGHGGAQVARIQTNYQPLRSAAEQTTIWRASLADKDRTKFLLLDDGNKTRIMVRLRDGKGMAFSPDGGLSDILCQILIWPVFVKGGTRDSRGSANV